MAGGSRPRKHKTCPRLCMGRADHLPKPKKGERLPGSGRKPGTPNALTRSVKEAFEHAFKDAQADPTHPSNLGQFSKEFPREFIAAAAKLIPTELKAELTAKVTPDIAVLLDAMGAKK